MSGLFCVLLCFFLVEIHADGGVDFKDKYCNPYRPGLIPDQAKAAMDVCFAIFMNERDYRPDNRRAVIERVCITFLLNTSTAVVRQFYLHHIKDIIGIIEAKQAKVSSYMQSPEPNKREVTKCVDVDILVLWKRFVFVFSCLLVMIQVHIAIRPTIWSVIGANER